MASAKFERNGYVFNAYWEDYPNWDGNQFYDSIVSAKTGAELDYLAEEYGYWADEEDDDEELPVPRLTWEGMGRETWNLYDNGSYTGVHIYMGPVMKLIEV
jgi:hypothetical protein